MGRILFRIYYYFGQFIILYNLCGFVKSKALVGENVQPVKNGQFPYIVSLMAFQNSTSQQGIHFCSGTLITKKDVLTCAHCLESKDIRTVAVIAGSNDLRRGRKYIPRTWVNYQQWAMIRRVPIEFKKNDVAIIKLRDSVPVEPATLSNVESSNLYGVDITLAGWGQLPSLEMPVFMRTAVLKTLTKTECERRLSESYGEPVPVHERILCSTANPSTILTYGDSGGPSIYQNEVIGVNTGTCLFQNEPFNPRRINLHLKIDYYRYFIEDIRNSN